MLANDVWKDIKGYEGQFLISYFGDVYALPKGQGSRPGVCKTEAVDASGYPIVHLLGKTKRVHILVAEHFLVEKPSNLHEVNHKDGNKSNFAASNLEWSTHSNNVKHAFDTGLQPKGSKRSTAKLNEVSVFEIKYRLRFGNESMSNIARDYKVSPGTIGYIKSGRNWSHVRWPKDIEDTTL